MCLHIDCMSQGGKKYRNLKILKVGFWKDLIDLFNHGDAAM